MQPTTARRETWLIAALCAVAAVRVFFFSAAFPFFNNVDELAHVDLVVKYSRGHVPREPVEHYDTETARLIATYHTLEYVQQPGQIVLVSVGLALNGIIRFTVTTKIVANHVVVLRQRRELPIPVAPVTGATVHQHQSLTRTSPLVK